MSKRLCRNGYTLAQLLIAITFIAILLVGVMPAIQRAREESRQTTCKNNLKMLALASHNYESAFSKLPRGVVYPRGFVLTSKNRAEQFFSWSIAIRPFLERSSDFDTMDPRNQVAEARWVSVSIRSNASSIRNSYFEMLTTPNSQLLCPSDSSNAQNKFRKSGITPGAGTPSLAATGIANSSYVAMNNSGLCHSEISTAEVVGKGINTIPNGMFQSAKSINMNDIVDGTSNTFMFGERVYGGLSRWSNLDHSRGALAYVVRGIGATDVVQVDAKDIPPHASDALASGQGGINLIVRGTVPNSYYRAYMGVSSQHPGGSTFALADATTHFVKKDIASWYQSNVVTGPSSSPALANFDLYERFIAINDGQAVRKADLE